MSSISFSVDEVIFMQDCPVSTEEVLCRIVPSIHTSFEMKILM
jgi:hypothetical protein